MTQKTNNKDKQNLKKYVVFAIMIAVFIGCLWLIFAPSGAKKDAEQEGIGFNADIPDPRGAGIVDDKKTAYEQEQVRQRQEEKMRSLEDYSYMLGSTDENSEEYQRQVRMAPVPPDYQEQLNEARDKANTGYSSYSGRRGNNIEASGSAYADLTASLGSVYEKPVEDIEKEELRQEIEQLKGMIDGQQSSMDDQVALLEKSFELAAKYNYDMNGAKPTPTSTVESKVENTGKKSKVEPVTHVRKNVVSSLVQPMSDEEFLEQFSRQRNFGFQTVKTKDEESDRNTISAVVHGDQVLIDGQSVRLRTTESMKAGKQVIPRNSIITGVAKISGERLEVSVQSIECEGNIIPVELTAYDSDGQRGIYIPGSMEIEAVKEIAGNMGQNLGTTINLNQQSAGEQLLTDLGRGAIQGTSQYISKKARQVKVTLKSGYRIFLLPSEII